MMIAMRPLAAFVILYGVADAAVLCGRPRGDLSFSATVKLRDVCKGNEVQLAIGSLAPLVLVSETFTATTTTSIAQPSSTSTSTTPGSTTTSTTVLSRHADNADGTITDAATGLTWEKLSDDGSIHDWDNRYSWSAAFEKIALLNATGFAGVSDWRLPSRLELESLLDLTIGPPGPATFAAFNSDCVFACTVSACSCTKGGDWYWSGTPYASGSNAVWGVHFTAGDVALVQTANLVYVRAVRGPAWP